MGRKGACLRGEIARCQICAEYLPNAPRPIVEFTTEARILIIGQAPGRLAHESGIAWDDPSGERLREWLAIDNAVFYDPAKVAIMPMGFCYPGSTATGDIPPRRECAPQWHQRIRSLLSEVQLTLLVGAYAQKAYLPAKSGSTLPERIRWSLVQGTGIVALPHPSWRVAGWMKRNAWFERDILPELRRQTQLVLKENIS